MGWLSGWDWQLVTGTALLALAFLLLLGVVVYPRLWILPGVRSLGVDLEGMTREQAVLALQQDWQARAVLLVDPSLRDGQATWSVPPVRLGLALDAEATVHAAFAQGRTWDKLWPRISGEWFVDVLPVLDVDPAVARDTLATLRTTVDVSPLNTSLRFAGGRVEGTQPRAGRSLDAIQSLSPLEERPLDVVASGRLDLIVHPVPPLAVDVSDTVARANEWLANTLSIAAYDPISDETLIHTLAPEQWAAWVSLVVDPVDPTRVRWTFDRRAAQAALEAWAASLGNGRFVQGEQALMAVESAIMEAGWTVRLRVYHLPSQYTVQFGETLSSISRKVGMPYPWIEQANPGVRDSLAVGQVLTIPSPDVLLPLPVVEDKRIIISLSGQRMWAYEKGALLWEWPVSTGIPSSPTAPGVFQVQSHDPNAYAASWDLWMPHFIGIYRPVPASNFMNGFHGFPTRDGASLLWTGDLGRPVTFGCILLGHTSAPLLFEWAEEGVIVEIRE